ncbi:MAG: hypothetical protein K2H72_03835, partial [Muribaculaceae bacterium]|nr:hypothetical protein [Muribaculaceae bacterium]
MDRHYTLTGKQGIYTAGSNRVTLIGQQEGCDIKIINPTQYEDVIFAKIIPNRGDDGWHLVKVTPYYPILVNGIEMNRVHFLQDGDNIEFPNGIVRFNIHDGEQSSPSIIHIHKNGKTLWLLAAAIAVIAAIVGYRIYDGQKDNLTDSMKDQIEASLFTVRVDSLQLIYGDSLIESYSYASGPIGTAFLTTDSLLVTARHCIQPWLNQVLPAEYAKIPEMSDWPIKSALFAETTNQLNDSIDCRIISFMTLTDEDGKSFPVSSRIFMINYENDDIVEVGDYRDTKYWRSISHRYTRRDMMLDDIAVARFNTAGNIPLSSSDEIRSLLAHRNVRLHFFGHPESAVTGNSIDYKSDNLRVELSDENGHISILAHEGGLTPGFSGAPVIVRDGVGFKAVGVASVIDEKNQNRSYSVPVSE